MNKLSDRSIVRSAAAKILLSIVAIAVVGGATYGTYFWQHRKVNELETQVTQLSTELTTVKKNQAPSMSYNYTSKKGVIAKIYTPVSNSHLTSPVVVMGEIPGNWSFEASFPVKLLDSKGNVIAQAPAQLQGDWMTEEPVQFTVKLTFASALSGDGALLLQKDNPSGLDTNNDSISIPIKL